MGSGSHKAMEIHLDSKLMSKLSGVNSVQFKSQDTLKMLISRFIYLHVKSLPAGVQQKTYDNFIKKPHEILKMKVSLNDLRRLNEFKFNPFVHRISELLTYQNQDDSDVDIQTFLKFMKIFCYETSHEEKKAFLFNIYDRDENGAVAIVELRNILGNELFTRSHYSEVENAQAERTTSTALRSSFSDRVLKDVMLEIMETYDQDSNKMVDLDEFMRIVTDTDVDLLLSVY